MTAVAWTCHACRSVSDQPEMTCGDPCCPRKQALSLPTSRITPMHMTDEDALVEELARAVSETGGAANWDHALTIARAILPIVNARLDAVTKAVEPILHWYQSDEHDPRPLADILTDVVADLQHDRAEALKLDAVTKERDGLRDRVAVLEFEANGPTPVGTPINIFDLPPAQALGGDHEG
jgi:hypothetical protein